MTTAAFSITYIGRTNHRNSNIRFGLHQADRRSHLYICGKTGTGKSHLLGLILKQDVLASRGCALLDPHGDLALKVRPLVSEKRADAAILLDAWDPGQPWRINPFQHLPDERRSLVAESVVEVFKKMWPDDWGPRLEHLLRNVAHTLIATPGSSLASIPPLLADKAYRTSVVSQLRDPVVQQFWTAEFDRYSPGFKAVAIAPLQNKVGAMMTDPVIRRILTEPGKAIDFRELIDRGGVLVANLDKGRIGEASCSLLGSLILAQVALAGLSRSDILEADRRDFFVCADECQLFTTLSLATMFSELRKYRIGLTLANQHLSQLGSEIRDAIFGNAGSIIAFRVGANDASALAREFGHRFSPADFAGLPKHSIYARLLIEGHFEEPFSAQTLTDAPLESPTPSFLTS